MLPLSTPSTRLTFPPPLPPAPLGSQLPLTWTSTAASPTALFTHRNRPHTQLNRQSERNSWPPHFPPQDLATAPSWPRGVLPTLTRRPRPSQIRCCIPLRPHHPLFILTPSVRLQLTHITQFIHPPALSSGSSLRLNPSSFHSTAVSTFPMADSYSSLRSQLRCHLQIHSLHLTQE